MSFGGDYNRFIRKRQLPVRLLGLHFRINGLVAVKNHADAAIVSHLFCKPIKKY